VRAGNDGMALTARPLQQNRVKYINSVSIKKNKQTNNNNI